MIERRLFIVTNRLPVYLNETGKAMPASGGLASSMQAYLRCLQQQQRTEFSQVCWVGVPGCSAETWTRATYNIDTSYYNYVPVHVTSKTYHAYYHLLANTVIWPLFHYFPSYAHYDFDAYEEYIKVNKSFAETLLKHIRVNDVIWIHDYHLLPLAAMLRKAMPGLTIGFFLHIPFPSFEIIRLMPRSWQQQLLSGMLGADLVGFHTIDYATHFLESVRMVMGLEHDLHIISFDNRLIKVDVFPIGIDFNKFIEAYDKQEVVQLRRSFRENFENRKIIFSIGRLNYTRGIFTRIKAYEYFLTTYPEFINKVVFVLVIVPSTDDLGKYAEQKKMIDQAISNINSVIGNINWQPVAYQYQSLSFDMSVALYSAGDLALITPLRDGMNLVSKEYVAARKDKKGVLVLSELAGAARELTGALMVNPNDIRETAEQIKQGLLMSDSEQTLRMENMQKRLSTYDICAWAGDFMQHLKDIKSRQSAFQVKFFNEYMRRSVFEQYQQAERRLLLLDYDGTLVPFAPSPADAKAGGAVLTILGQLCRQKGNEVVIISGRNSDWLEEQVGHLPLSLIAEYGAKMKLKDGLWRQAVKPSEGWKTDIEKIMAGYTMRCAQTFIEHKEFSIAWHYRNAVPEEAKLRSLELYSELNQLINHSNLQVILGNHVVEVRMQGIGKDHALKKMLAGNVYDFILAMGHDQEDEDMFKVLQNEPNAFTIKIGAEASFAKYNLLTQQMAVSFLDNLSALRQPLIAK